MSEYQYYEFVAVDRPLSSATMKWLRGLSTRAEITPTRFVNTYEWGDFKGDPEELLRRGFDAHVYTSNFGYCRFMVRLPIASLDMSLAKPYCRGAGPRLIQKKDCIIVEFAWDSEPDDADGSDDGSGWMGVLLGVRGLLLDGDLSPLYLAWLINVQTEQLDDDVTEPAFPAGLTLKSAPLRALAQFLRLDPGLVATATAGSNSSSVPKRRRRELADWISRLPRTDADKALVAWLAGDEAKQRQAMLARFHKQASAQAQGDAGNRSPRTVGELCSGWQRIGLDKR